MVDLNVEYHKRALLRIDDLTKGKIEKGKGKKGLISESFDYNDKFVSSKDDGTTKIKVFIEITKEEPSVGKADITPPKSQQHSGIPLWGATSYGEVVGMLDGGDVDVTVVAMATVVATVANKGGGAWRRWVVDLIDRDTGSHFGVRWQRSLKKFFGGGRRWWWLAGCGWERGSNYPVNHHISQADVEEVLQDKEKFMQDTQTFLEKFNLFSFEFTPRVLTIAWERIDKIKYVLTEPEEIPELMYKLREDVRNIIEELAEYIDSPIWNCPIFFYDEDEVYTIQYREYLEKSPDAVTTVLPTEEPEYSLSMGECEVTSDDESEYDVPIKDESFSVFTTFSNPLFDDNVEFTSSDDESLPDEDVPTEEFKVYSNPLFDDEEISSDEIDSHYFNAESDLIESLLNQNNLIDSSPKFDFLLKEFSGDLTHINLILPEIKEADFYFEEEIHLIENLLYDNSSPRSPKELNAEITDMIVESLPSSLIPVQDNDSQREEIDIVSDTDELIPPGFENDDSEEDIHFLEELLADDSIPLPENESSNFNHQDNNSSFPRPPRNHRMLSLILSPMQEKRFQL
nr:hypothetical protein [Tanacetum cinerariifolium]